MIPPDPIPHPQTNPAQDRGIDPEALIDSLVALGMAPCAAFAEVWRMAGDAFRSAAIRRAHAWLQQKSLERDRGFSSLIQELLETDPAFGEEAFRLSGELDIWGAPTVLLENLKGITCLPENLHLRSELMMILHCPDLYALPKSITLDGSLSLFDCPRLEAMEGVPERLESLSVIQCQNLKPSARLTVQKCHLGGSTWEEFPKGWTVDQELTLNGCSKIRSLIIPSGFPPMMLLSDCPLLESISDLQDRVDRLFLRAMPKLRGLPAFKGSELSLSGHLPEILELSPVEAGLLNIQNSPDLRTVRMVHPTEAMPSSAAGVIAQSVGIRNCPSLESLDLPIRTVGLGVQGCPLFVSLPAQLEVSFMRIRGCMSFKEIPEGLTMGGSLMVEDCPEFTRLPNGLTLGGHLLIRGCGKWDRVIPTDARISGKVITDVPSIDIREVFGEWQQAPEGRELFAELYMGHFQE